MKRKDELQDIARMTHGPERRALLIAEFGVELRQRTMISLASLGTETLFSLLGVDTRVGPQRGPAPDPEAE